VTPLEAPARTASSRPLLGATVLLVLALLAIAALKSSRDLEAARARERLLETRIAETHARSEKLKSRIERLKHDPGMLERLAREDLGLVRPGDVIVELPDPDAPAPKTVPAPPAPVPASTPIPEAGSAGPPEAPAAVPPSAAPPSPE
jgi:cell division protein FtsB